MQAQGIQVGQHVNVVNNGTVRLQPPVARKETPQQRPGEWHQRVFIHYRWIVSHLHGEQWHARRQLHRRHLRTNSVGQWACGGRFFVAFRNTAWSPQHDTGSQGEVDCSYIGADNADVSSSTAGRFPNNNGVCVWLEQDSDVGDMRIDNSGIIASSQTGHRVGSIQRRQHQRHCYVTNTARLAEGGWVCLE